MRSKHLTFATRRRRYAWKRSIEVCLDKTRAGVDVDLTQRVLPELTKRCGVPAGMTAMPPACISRCSSPTVMVARPSIVKSHFGIGMRMQRRTFSWLRRDDVGRERRALFLADKFVRHSDKRQLLEMGEAHARKPMLVLARNTFVRVPRRFLTWVEHRT